MHTRLLAAATALALSASSVFAGPLVEVDLAPMTHAEASLLIVGADGAEFEYSPAELEGFTTYSMTRFLDKAADGLLRTSEVLQLTALKSVIAQEVLWPVSLYVALVIALGRLYSDWEMTALRSFGFAERQIVRQARPVDTGKPPLFCFLGDLENGQAAAGHGSQAESW